MSIIYINPYRFAAAAAYDPDAQSYITAVEAADGQALEVGVKDAINDFVVGCKSDGIWAAIKAACIMAGARTLAGALVPLVGTAPTNNNFVAGDYNRETGLVGDGSTKYLNSNRKQNADPQDSRHLSVYGSSFGTQSGGVIGSGQGAGDSHFYGATSGTKFLRMCNFDTSFDTTGATITFPFAGLVRSGSNSYSLRLNNSNTTINKISGAPTANDILLFQVIQYSNPRLAFYSIGEALDLALLDARVTALVNAIGAAIP